MLRHLAIFSLFASVVCFLISCSKNQSASYYLLHPEKIEVAYNQCALLKHPFQSSECANLLEAIPIFKNYLMELVQKPGHYALSIMSLENNLARLQKQYQMVRYQQTDSLLLQKLRYEIDKQRLELQVRFAVMRLAFRMARA